MSSEDTSDPKFPKKVLSIPSGRLPSIACVDELSSSRSRLSLPSMLSPPSRLSFCSRLSPPSRLSPTSRPPRSLIRCVMSSSPNELQSPVAIEVGQILTAGREDPILDQLMSSLSSNDETNYFFSEIGAFVVRNGSSSGAPQAYSETKPAEATQDVNSWAEKVTNGRIKRILPPMVLDKSTKLVFKNALNLKGQWDEKFDASDTQDNDFHLLGGIIVKVPFMVSKEKQLVSACDGFKVLAIPLKQVQGKGHFSLNIFLPDAKDGLPTLEDMVFSQ